MRSLLRCSMFAMLLPLSACYVGNTPPISRHGGNTPSTSAPAPTSDPAACSEDSDCGDNAVCVRDGSPAHCAMRAPAADTTAQRCAHVCGAHVCGEVVDEVCGHVMCGVCGDGQQCRKDGQACEDLPPVGPMWRVRVERAEVARCSAAWDTCSVQSSLCSPTLPDPYVTIGTGRTGILHNGCSARYDADMGAMSEGELRTGVVVSFLDDDSPATDDVICRTAHAFTDEEFAAGRAEVSCDNGSVYITLTREP